MAKTLKAAKMNDKYIGVFPFEFADKSGAVALPDTIQLIPIGQWEHDLYGPIMVTDGDIREFIQNFNANVRKGVYITAGHEGFDELPAQGWITSVEARDTGLWGKVEWNELGRATLSDKQFKFISPEFYRDYEDPQTHQIYRNVLIGAALTKSPYFKELEAVVFSDRNIKSKFDTNNTMDLKTLIAKKIEELNDAEKAFIIEHKAELSEEEKTALTSIIDVETAEQKEAREAKEKTDKDAADAKAKEDANIAAGLNADGSAKEEAPKVEASTKKIEMVQISASELTALKAKADDGAQAFATLKKQKLDTAVSALVFSESNRAGKFLPKSKDNLRAFMETLNEGQMKSFSAILGDLPKAEIFGENGTTTATEGSAQAEVELAVGAKMKADSKLKYSEALKQVFSETAGLEERYSKELPSARKQG